MGWTIPEPLAGPVIVLVVLIWLPLSLLFFAVAFPVALVFDYTVGLVARPLGFRFSLLATVQRWWVGMDWGDAP